MLAAALNVAALYAERRFAELRNAGMWVSQHRTPKT
jgi:hypothetical protein